MALNHWIKSLENNIISYINYYEHCYGKCKTTLYKICTYRYMNFLKMLAKKLYKHGQQSKIILD